MAFDEARKPLGENAYVGYVGRRDSRNHKHSHQELLDRYGSAVCMCERVPQALSDDLGDMAYIVRLDKKAEIEAFFKFATEEYT